MVRPGKKGERCHKPMKSVTCGQCDARPTFTFPALGQCYPLTITKLYCSLTGNIIMHATSIVYNSLALTANDMISLSLF